MGRPLIGVTTAWSVETWGHPMESGGYYYAGAPYAWAVRESGAIPVLIPQPPDQANLDSDVSELLKHLDGLLLTGGGDARTYTASEKPLLKAQQPVRYKFEERLIKSAWNLDMPVLGICRGFQMIVEVLGGRLSEQPIQGHKQLLPGVEPSHEISITPGSSLHRICGVEKLLVNSFHSQAVATLPDELLVSALSADGVIEAVEAPTKRFFLGLQFHPEEMFAVNEIARRIFKAFVDAAV